MGRKMELPEKEKKPSTNNGRKLKNIQFHTLV